MYALTNCILHTGQHQLTEHAVLIQNGQITGVFHPTALPARCPTVNLQGQHLAPGFIDLQLNGCGGVMFNDAIASDTLNTMHQTNLKSGTTSFLPTLITAPDRDMLDAISVVQDYRQHHPHTVLGLHLEGPYLNPSRKGIHNAAYVRQLDRAMRDEIARRGETVRLLTLAPEMVAAEDIRCFAERGIVVAAGHSNASFEQAIDGFDAGVQMVTHLFNAMSPWQGRSPGMVGAALHRSDVYAGVIADGHHVHFASIQLAQRLKPRRLILVSDATPPVGANLTSFQIGGQEVFYRDGKCVSADGTLGGSALTLIEAVANCVRQVGIQLSEALRMVSTYPAELLGVDRQLGQIAAGYVANLVVFDAEFRVTGVVDRGNYIQLSPTAIPT